MIHYTKIMPYSDEMLSLPHGSCTRNDMCDACRLYLWDVWDVWQEEDSEDAWKEGSEDIMDKFLRVEWDPDELSDEK